jgi:hypothetical protein
MKVNRVRSKDKCAGKLEDDTTACRFKALLNERYCGVHKKKYEKIDAENLLKEEKRKLEEERLKLEPKIELVVSDFKKQQLEIINNIDKNDPDNSNLLVVMFPESVKIIDFDKNNKQGLKLDFTQITYASRTYFNWLCPNNIPEHGTYTIVAGKTSNYKEVDGKKIIKGCKVCCVDASRVHDKEKVNKKKFEKRDNVNQSTLTGDSSELYITNILKATGKYKNVEKIGNSGGKGDVRITHFDDTVNYIEVKTLTKRKRDKNGFTLRLKKAYEENMLIVGVDNERKFFILDFFGNIGVGARGYFFYGGRCKYKNTMYTDQNLFLNKCHELIPHSSKINKHNLTYTKERESLERFAAYCKANSIEYRKNDTNSNTIDGYINGYKFQAKFKGENEERRNIFKVNFSKSAGLISGKQIRKSYSVGDFDFFVVELGLNRDGSKDYRGNFCIIPAHELERADRFQTDDELGNTMIPICPPDYEKDHWSKQFWNRIDLIPKPKV